MKNSLRLRSRFTLNGAAAAAMAFATLGAASAALASGSMNAYGGAGPDAYSTGKSILYKQVVCGSCPYAGRAKDAADAKMLRETLNSADSKVKLDDEDKSAVNTYLTGRFHLGDAMMADKK